MSGDLVRTSSSLLPAIDEDDETDEGRSGAGGNGRRPFSCTVLRMNTVRSIFPLCLSSFVYVRSLPILSSISSSQLIAELPGTGGSGRETRWSPSALAATCAPTLISLPSIEV